MSLSSSRRCYHVYLTFKHNDSCNNFVNNLYSALMQAGILTFPNSDKPVVSEMRKAINDSTISIVVFTEEFAYSRRCLDQLSNVLERKTTRGRMVFPVFYKVDPSHIRKHKGNYAKALFKLEQEIMAEKNQQSVSSLEKWKLSLTDAANLAGIVFDQGDEAEFIQEIVHRLWNKLSRSVLSVAPYPVGMYPRVKDMILWVQDSSPDTRFSLIYGEAGIGKTTMAKAVYDLYSGRFDACSFISDLGGTEEGMNGLVHLQSQLLKISKGKEVQVYNLDDGYSKIKEAFQNKKFLLVVDDVERREQVDVVIGIQHCFDPGSKVIVITRNESLTHHSGNCLVFKVGNLGDHESLQLFCWHAFGHDHPMKGYMEHSRKFVKICGGLPLALQVVGSSLHDVQIDQWTDTLSNLENRHDSCIQKVLKVSYESLQDDHEKNLFLEIACFFIGEDKDCTINTLDECGYYTTTGIHNLVDRCLLTIDEHNKLRMHHLLQEMAKDVIRQESVSALGRRSRIWHFTDALTILQEEIGSENIEGFSLKLDSSWGNRAVRHESRSERHSTRILKGHTSKRLCVHLLSWISVHRLSTALDSTIEGYLTTDAFSKMCELRILHLKNVHLHGSYKGFPKKIKWLRWDEFQLQSIPNGFPLENIAVLEMQNSNLKQIWQGTKCLMSLKSLNLSHSYSLTVTPDFSGLSNLERLVFEDCINLIEIHNSIGNLRKLLLLDLKGCVSLRKLPWAIGKLESLEKLVLSGNLELEFSMIQGKLSLPELCTGRSSRTQSRSTFAELDFSGISFGKMINSFCLSWMSPCRSKNVLNSVLNLLPDTLVSLDLSDCNLTEKGMPTNLKLPSLLYLNLSRNPISELPGSIKGLTTLQSFELVGCRQLQSLPELPSSLKMLDACNCRSLEKIINLPNFLVSLDLHLDDCGKLVEVQSLFKLKPIRNIQDLLSKWDLIHFHHSGGTYVELVNCLTFTKSKYPLMALLEFGILSTFIPGAKVVPGWFKKTSTEDAIHIDVPCISDISKYWVDICVVYETASGDCESNAGNCIIIKDKTKRIKWIYSPVFFAVEGSSNSILWLTRWNFGNQLEGGDQIAISINMNFQVKEFGVHFIFDEQELDTCLRTTEEDIHQHFLVSAQHDVSHLSAYQPSEGIYLLSHHP